MKYCTFVCICGNDALKKNLRKKNPYLGSARKKNQSKEFLGANPIHIQKLCAQNCDKNRDKNGRKTNQAWKSFILDGWI